MGVVLRPYGGGRVGTGLTTGTPNRLPPQGRAWLRPALVQDHRKMLTKRRTSSLAATHVRAFSNDQSFSGVEGCKSDVGAVALVVLACLALAMMTQSPLSGALLEFPRARSED